MVFAHLPAIPINLAAIVSRSSYAGVRGGSLGGAIVGIHGPQPTRRLSRPIDQRRWHTNMWMGSTDEVTAMGGFALPNLLPVHRP